MNGRGINTFAGIRPAAGEVQCLKEPPEGELPRGKEKLDRDPALCKDGLAGESDPENS